MDLAAVLLLPVVHYLIQPGNQLIEAELVGLAHFLPQAFAENAAVQSFADLLYSRVDSRNQELRTGVYLADQGRSTELVVLQVLGLELDVDGEDEFLLVLAEHHSGPFLEQLDPALVDEVG